MPAIRLALEECRKSHASELVLPEGVLRIRPEHAYEKYQFISNNNESLKRIAFDLEGMENFTVSGNDTELLFTGFISPFSLENGKNLKIKAAVEGVALILNRDSDLRKSDTAMLDDAFGM